MVTLDRNYINTFLSDDKNRQRLMHVCSVVARRFHPSVIDRDELFQSLSMFLLKRSNEANGLELQEGEKIFGYCKTLANNICNAILRKRKFRREVGIQTVSDEAEIDTNTPSTIETLERQEELILLDKAIESLPPKFKEVVRVRLAGHLIEEIAIGEEVIPRTVKYRLTLAREKIRAYMNRQYAKGRGM